MVLVWTRIPITRGGGCNARVPCVRCWCHCPIQWGRGRCLQQARARWRAKPGGGGTRSLRRPAPLVVLAFVLPLLPPQRTTWTCSPLIRLCWLMYRSRINSSWAYSTPAVLGLHFLTRGEGPLKSASTDSLNANQQNHLANPNQSSPPLQYPRPIRRSNTPVTQREEYLRQTGFTKTSRNSKRKLHAAMRDSRCPKRRDHRLMSFPIQN